MSVETTVAADAKRTGSRTVTTTSSSKILRHEEEEEEEVFILSKTIVVRVLALVKVTLRKISLRFL